MQKRNALLPSAPDFNIRSITATRPQHTSKTADKFPRWSALPTKVSENRGAGQQVTPGRTRIAMRHNARVLDLSRL